MKRFILGLTMFIGGIIGVGLSLVGNGANAAGETFRLWGAYHDWVLFFSVLGMVGLIISLYDLQADKNANKINS